MTTRIIDGNTFTVSPLGYEETCDLQPLLAPALADFFRLYGLIVTEVVKAVGEDSTALDSDVMGLARKMLPELQPSLAEFSRITADLAAKLPGTTLRTIRRTLLRGALIDGAPLYALTQGGPEAIDRLKGRTLTGWRLLLFALEVNYPDFFALARSVAGAKAASPSNSTSTTP